jgi:hypothetical protein
MDELRQITCPVENGPVIKGNNPCAPASLQDRDDPVWQYFTVFEVCLFVGPDLAANSSATSAVECASLCLEEQSCEFFAWCPTDATRGYVPGLSSSVRFTCMALRRPQYYSWLMLPMHTAAAVQV